MGARRENIFKERSNMVIHDGTQEVPLLQERIPEGKHQFQCTKQTLWGRKKYRKGHLVVSVTLKWFSKPVLLIWEFLDSPCFRLSLLLIWKWHKGPAVYLRDAQLCGTGKHPHVAPVQAVPRNWGQYSYKCFEIPDFALLKSKTRPLNGRRSAQMLSKLLKLASKNLEILVVVRMPSLSVTAALKPQQTLLPN